MKDWPFDLIRAAVIGGSQCGKTFRMKGYSRGLWRQYALRTLAFDPWLRERTAEPWGKHAWVTDNFELWKRVVSRTEDAAAIWDEATTHGGDDDENISLLTEIRHRHPVLIAAGHSHSSLMRGMRVNLTHLDLALSDDIDAMLWARTMKDPELKRASDAALLPKYAFMRKRPYATVTVVRDSAERVRAGILP